MHTHTHTKNDSLNSKRSGNCWRTWCTQSNHCKKMGHLSSGLDNPPTGPNPQRSANLCPNCNHSRSTSTQKPWRGGAKERNMSMHVSDSYPTFPVPPLDKRHRQVVHTGAGVKYFCLLIPRDSPEWFDSRGPRVVEPVNSVGTYGPTRPCSESSPNSSDVPEQWPVQTSVSTVG